MQVALATAWHPRGELTRLEHNLPLLQQAYSGISIALPPDANVNIIRVLESWTEMTVTVTPEWSWGRYLALKNALTYPVPNIMYADLDRLLRWVETQPDEWQHTIKAFANQDFLIIGRTEKAYHTHPRSLIETEAISNRVTSYFLNLEVDVSAGAKGFSRHAAEFIAANCRGGQALGTDAEWPILLKRAGFRLDTVFVNGLDWESADRYQTQPADSQIQATQAAAYDADPSNWSHRVKVAQEIIQAAIIAQNRVLPTRD
jgi:hypothetical protein